MDNNSILVVKDLYKVFYSHRSFFKSASSFVAVDKISFEVNSGEIVGILGPNGAGKTTTIQMLLSTLAPTSGDIFYFGKSLFDNSSAALQHVAFASTYLRLPGRLTVMENLKVYGKMYQMKDKIILDRASKYLKFFDIWEIKDKEISQLSAGQITRVMIVKAFLSNPKIVLLDEPTASLDIDIAYLVRDFLIDQRKNHRVSILLTSHNMDEVASVCDRVLVLRDGKIIASNTPESLAESVSLSRLHLMVPYIQDKEKIIDLLKDKNFYFKQEEHSFEITLDEHKIANLLMDLASLAIYYSQISIDTPTLEDYFLQLIQK